MSENLCKYCLEPIAIKARVCRTCGRAQSLRSVHLFIGLAGSVSAVTAVCLLIVGLYQLVEAKRERANAREALRVASEAQARSKLVAQQGATILCEQQKLVEKISASFFELFFDNCTTLGGNFEANSSSCILRDGERILYPPALRNQKQGPNVPCK